MMMLVAKGVPESGGVTDNGVAGEIGGVVWMRAGRVEVTGGVGSGRDVGEGHKNSSAIFLLLHTQMDAN